MRMRTFSGERLHQALAGVREEFGPDALILERRRETDASGKTIWRVRAALDNTLAEGTTPGASGASSQPPLHHASSGERMDYSPEIEHGLQRSMQQLQRLMDGLERSETISLRAALEHVDERRAFDEIVRRGVAATHAATLARCMVRGERADAPFLRWGRPLAPEKRREAVLISGPSGAGKTTMIAGLATHFHLKGHEIAFVSTDTERMGGVESLQAYASLIGVEAHALRNADEAGEILEKTDSARLLLIDSQGWSPTNRRALNRQKPLWTALSPNRRMLVLPANMDEADGMAMLDAAGATAFTDLLPSRIDETSAVGKIVNWSAAAHLPLSYCSFGPTPPDHMGWLSAKTLFTLLGKKRTRETE